MEEKYLNDSLDVNAYRVATWGNHDNSDPPEDRKSTMKNDDSQSVGVDLGVGLSGKRFINSSENTNKNNSQTGTDLKGTSNNEFADITHPPPAKHRKSMYQVHQEKKKTKTRICKELCIGFLATVYVFIYIYIYIYRCCTHSSIYFS